MAKNGTVAYVGRIPTCDIHGDHPAAYDIGYIPHGGRTVWGFVCEALFKEYGGRLGTGVGQKLELRQPKKRVQGRGPMGEPFNPNTQSLYD
jgi:hypothetical protein